MMFDNLFIINTTLAKHKHYTDFKFLFIAFNEK